MNSYPPEPILARLPLILAVAASTAWIVFAALYLRGLPGGLRGLSPAEAGALFAGIGGPLAGLWLFVAVNEQRRRLALMSRALGEMLAQHRHTLQIAESQTRTLVALQAQSARNESADARRLALQDMAASVAVLAERLGVLRREDLDVTWARFGSGDIAAFVHPFLAFAISHPEITTRLAEAVGRDPLAAAALQAYVRRYERLVDTAEDRLVRDVLEEGALGRAFRLFKPAVVAAEHPVGRDVTSQLAAFSERLDAVADR